MESQGEDKMKNMTLYIVVELSTCEANIGTKVL